MLSPQTPFFHLCLAAWQLGWCPAVRDTACRICMLDAGGRLPSQLEAHFLTVLSSREPLPHAAHPRGLSTIHRACHHLVVWQSLGILLSLLERRFHDSSQVPEDMLCVEEIQLV